MAHKRNDKQAKTMRWEENKERGYRTYSFDPGSNIHPSRFAREVSRKSDHEYVDTQIRILSERV